MRADRYLMERQKAKKGGQTAGETVKTGMKGD